MPFPHHYPLFLTYKTAPLVITWPNMKFLEDFYYNQDGMMVFTESYHLKRGYCCGSGCLHCPFDGITIEEGGQGGKNSNLVLVQCPFCFESFNLPMNAEDGSEQQFVYDCEVCCHPIALTLHFNGEELLSVSAEKSN